MRLNLFHADGARNLPIVLAAEAAECGLACMAMVGAYHGHALDLNGLRQRFSVSLNGMTLRHLISVGSALGFSARALKTDLSALADAQRPCILHWDLSHFVVLKAADRKGLTIHDPAFGERRLSWAEADKHYSGVLLELRPELPFRKQSAIGKVGIRHLWSESSGLGSALVQILVLSAILQAVAFLAPFQIQLVLDQAIGRSDQSILVVIALGFLALLVIQALVDFLRNYIIQVFGNTFNFYIVSNLIRHLLRLPTAYFERRHIGDIMSRIASSGAIQDALTKGGASALIDGIMVPVAAAILLLYSPLLAGISILALLLTIAISVAFYPLIKARTDQQLVAASNDQSHLIESIRGAATIKMFGGAAEREGAWQNLRSRTLNATVSVANLQIGNGLAQTLLMGASTILVLYFGARAVISGTGMSIGMLIAFLSFRQTFNDRSLALINQGVQFRLLGLHLERLGDIVAAKPDVGPDIVLSAAVGPVRGAIALEGVSFRYSDADRWIFQNLDLAVEPGEFLAITGPSGGGKTTLMKLMTGLHPPTAGRIVLDGKIATPELLQSWRRQVGVVAQDDRLFSGTIAENIAFFDPHLNMDDVIAAARAAAIDAEILAMPMQYLSLIGDMGTSLSGGQRQRVLLARALYRKPAILFLDEGTANLDADAEARIVDMICGLPITRIVIAHRPALLERAGRVISVGERLQKSPP